MAKEFAACHDEARSPEARSTGACSTGARSPVMLRFLHRLNPALADSFSNEQLAAVEMHFGMRYRANHMIDWRTQIRFPFIKLYLVILAGPDRIRGER